MKNFSPIQLFDYLNQTDHQPLLLDVREPWEFEICHIDGSKHIPMHKVVRSLDLLDSKKETVVICHHGVRSRMVAAFLESRGFGKIINLYGGISAWSSQVDQKMARY